MKNRLLNNSDLPVFSQIKPEFIEPALDEILAKNRARIAEITNNSPPYTWENLIQPLEELDNELDKFWSPISHLHAVMQTPELRTVYKSCLPKLTAYHTELEQNEKLYQAFLFLAESAAYKNLNQAQQKLIQNQLRDFRLAGVALSPEKKQRFAEIQTRLAELTTQFEEHILDATEAWTKHIVDEKELAGVPAHALTAAHEKAQQKNLPGWLLTLDFPCYFPTMSYAHNRALRQEMYTAYVTRASDQGPQAGQFDNSIVMVEILKLRHELSRLLDFNNFAELSLATKMVKRPQEVLDFLNNLIQRVKTKAIAELAETQAFAEQQLQPWDITYYSEKLREQQYGINDEMLRPYFPVDHVLQGMFDVVTRLYGMQINEVKDVDVWHSDVRFFAIHDQQGQLRGQFYLDLYARTQKRGGAWMDDHCSRFIIDEKLQTPIAYLTCNLTPPNNNKPALLTHDEVITLFHEFGHGLHHMLTQVNYPSVSGINGVAWDAVELPSQFMEFFVWEKAGLDLVSQHHQTSESLPENLLQKIIAAKNFHLGLGLLRQLEFALFDFRLHLEFTPDYNARRVQQLLDEVRATTALLPVPDFNRFQHSFSHIFAGGYAAGYYSYLWAEVLASDAFAKFQVDGILNAATGQKFLQTILEKGGSADALDLFIAFCGRAPTIDALLKQYGID
jgi:oligopeptidase A